MKFHDELNPKLWDKEDNLKDEVYDKLVEITEAFLEYIDIPEEAVKDVRITGSSANYNYTPHSDLDVHVIVDYDKVHEDCPVVEGYLWSMKAQFNKEHDISIHKIPVELYAEDSRVEAISNGVFSLMNDEWIKKPERIEPTTNDAAVEAKYNELKEAVDKCDDSEEAQELQDKIYQMRKTGLSEVGEFSTENLAFKKLRDAGCLDKLKQIKKEKIDKELTLESFNEDKEKYFNNNSSPIRTFIELHKDYLSEEPKPYYGDRDIDEVLAFLGSTDGIEANVETPIETITFNENNLHRLLYDNEEKRIDYLGRVKATLKEPNLIIETKDNKTKHNYVKAFITDRPKSAQLVVVKIAEDGVFYVTTFGLANSKLKGLLDKGQIIYDVSDNNMSEARQKFKRAYLNREDVGKWELTTNFNYFNRSKVKAEDIDTAIVWNQQDNSIYKNDEKIDNKNSLENTLTSLDVKDFPVKDFIQAVNKIEKDTKINYPIYNKMYNNTNTLLKESKSRKEDTKMKEDINKPMFKVGDKVKIMVSMYKGKFRTGTIKDILAAHKYEVEIDPVEGLDDKKVSVYYTKDLEKSTTSKPESYRKLTRTEMEIEKLLNANGYKTSQVNTDPGKAVAIWYCDESEKLDGSQYELGVKVEGKNFKEILAKLKNQFNNKNKSSQNEEYNYTKEKYKNHMIIWDGEQKICFIFEPEGYKNVEVVPKTSNATEENCVKAAKAIIDRGNIDYNKKAVYEEEFQKTESLSIKKLNEEIEAALAEPIEPYDKDEIVDDARLVVTFNYNYACAVMLEREDFQIVWDQYDNAIYYTKFENDEESVSLPRREKLIPTDEDIKEALSKIDSIPEDFPIDLFIHQIEIVNKDIEDNYSVYWNNYQK